MRTIKFRCWDGKEYELLDSFYIDEIHENPELLT